MKKLELDILKNINKVLNNKKSSLHEPQFFSEDIAMVNDALKSTYVSSSGKYIVSPKAGPLGIMVTLCNGSVCSSNSFKIA